MRKLLVFLLFVVSIPPVLAQESTLVKTGCEVARGTFELTQAVSRQATQQILSRSTASSTLVQIVNAPGFQSRYPGRGNFARVCLFRD